MAENSQKAGPRTTSAAFSPERMRINQSADSEKNGSPGNVSGTNVVGDVDGKSCGDFLTCCVSP
jgi:hypothetical protein